MSESESLLQLLLPLVDVSAPGIFRLSGNNNRQLRLVDAIRCGQDTKTLELNSHDVATVVKQVLREYPGRVFDSTTESVLSRLAKDNSDAVFHRMRDILKTLSPDRISLLGLVLPFLHKVSQMSDVNKMDASNLARVVALDFFPDIFNPTGTDSTLVRQIIDWRINVVEKLIDYGDRLIEESLVLPVTPISHATSTTPVYGKSESTTTCLTGEVSQKRKRPPQSPLKSVWHGLTNIFSKTPRPGRPESTPPNGTPSFFSKFSNRLCPSGKKVKHEDDDNAETVSGYRSDDNSLRCPPVKQNLRARFSHKKKSPKVTTPGRLKTPSTPLYASNYGTFTKNPFPVDQVRTELFHFTTDHAQPSTSSSGEPKNECQTPQFGTTFVFSSSQQNLSQQCTVATATVHPPLSPVNISPDLPDDESSTNPLVDNNFTGESNNSNSSESCGVFGTMDTEDAMETATCETEVVTRSTTSNSLQSLLQPVQIPDPSPSLSHLADEMRDNLCDLLNIGITPRCRQPILEKVHNPFGAEPVVETTFDGKDEAEKRLIAQVRRQLAPVVSGSVAGSGSRRPSVANLERMGQVSQGRRLWEQGIPCTSTLSNQPSAFSLAVNNVSSDQMQIQSNSYPRFHAPTSAKRQTDL